jgi:hypothetical protein
MEKHLLNCLKKPEQHNEQYIVIGNPDDRKELYKETHIFIQKIIPNRVIEGKRAYHITHLDIMYHIDGFEVSLENSKVMNVRLFGFHPNCDPNTDNFCLPDFKKDVKFSSEYLKTIITNIETYYLDSSYFNPLGKHLRYE